MSENIPDRPDPFVGSNAQRHGCLWFEGEVGTGPKDKSAGGGWAAIGGEAPFHFNNVKDLPLDIVWWTNLNRAEHWRFGKMKFFKESSFFGPEWISLIGETGMTTDSLSVIVRRWSETFARAAEWLGRWSEKVDPSQPWTWGEGNLSDALIPWLKLNDVPERPEIEDGLKKAYCEEIVMHVQPAFLHGKRSVTLSMPRWTHAMNMIKTVYPKGDWSQVEEWPENNEERIRWINEYDYPLLVQIDNILFNNNHEDAASAELFIGQRGKRFHAAIMEPLWLTAQEITVLNNYASFDVVSAYTAESWEMTEFIPGLMDDSEGPLIPWSMTKGLLATSTWRAMASPGRDPQSRKKGILSPRAVWIRAHDRIYCFAAAQVLQEMGYTVLNYGNGQIKIAFDVNGSATLLAEVAYKTGLLLPTILAEQIPIHLDVDKENFPSEMYDVAGVDQWLKTEWIKEMKMDANSTTIPEAIHLDIDRLVLPWSGPGTGAVLKSAANRLIKISQEVDPKMKQWWEAALGQQARFSVDRIKELKKRSN